MLALNSQEAFSAESDGFAEETGATELELLEDAPFEPGICTEPEVESETGVELETGVESDVDLASEPVNEPELVAGSEPFRVVDSEIIPAIPDVPRVEVITPSEALIAERELWLAKREERLSEREATLGAREQQLSSREQEVAFREQRLLLEQELLRTQQQNPEGDSSSTELSDLPGVWTIDRIKQMLTDERPVTWLFTGEANLTIAKPSKTIRSLPAHFEERVRFELRRLMDVVIDTSVEGTTTPDLLRQLEDRAARFSPDVLSVFVGTADAKGRSQGLKPFRRHLQELIDYSKEEAIQLLLQTPNRIDFSLHSDEFKYLRTYVRILREVSAENDVPLIDHWNYWKKKKPAEEERAAWLEIDGLKPNPFGQKAMARLLFATLSIYDVQSPICSAALSQ